MLLHYSAFVSTADGKRGRVMKHEISVLGCGVIYIDNERVFGSKPYGLFSTVNWSATDEDLKRIADRCLELEDEPNKEYFGEGNYYRCKQIPYWSISESMRNRLEPYDEADRKTENSSEKPNNCEDEQTERSE